MKSLSQAQKLVLAAALVLAAPLVQCGVETAGTDLDDGGVPETSTGTSSSGGSSSGFGACDGPCPPPPDTGTTSVCGDKELATTEGCDDGNLVGGDGCSTTCTVEPGWVCPTPGLPCSAAKCGDGILAGAEECELPAGTPITGCTAECKIEPGYDCDPSTKVCNPVVCGDGKVQRGETCEDGNDIPFDGCYKCQKEPSCVNGVCQGACGDGQRFGNEQCDDGNTRSGDGCSSTCTIEPAFDCVDVVGQPPQTIDLPVLARDFIGVGNALDGGVPHIDFNGLGGGGVLNILEPFLDAGRPVLNCPDAGPDAGECDLNPGYLYIGTRRNITTRANFDQWYRTGPTNKASVFTVTLDRQVDGTYVWNSATPAQNGGKSWFDPIGAGGWVDAGLERQVCPVGLPDGGTLLRNVSFTSETHFWFEYQGGERFDFSGDDDTWVFVNGRLAIDLGGLHNPHTGFFVLDDDTDGDAGPDIADGGATFQSTMPPNPPQIGTLNLGLQKGGIYEVVMFQAERNQCGSNFKVTLRDFNKPKSVCASTCGDGKIASNELCDDGKNDGSYGGCMPGCKARGPRCGDGIVQGDKGEQCDDGNTNNEDTCTNGCRLTQVK